MNIIFSVTKNDYIDNNIVDNIINDIIEKNESLKIFKDLDLTIDVSKTRKQEFSDFVTNFIRTNTDDFHCLHPQFSIVSSYLKISNMYMDKDNEQEFIDDWFHFCPMNTGYIINIYSNKMINSLLDDKEYQIIENFEPNLYTDYLYTDCILPEGYTKTSTNYVLLNRAVEMIEDELIKELAKRNLVYSSKYSKRLTADEIVKIHREEMLHRVKTFLEDKSKYNSSIIRYGIVITDGLYTATLEDMYGYIDIRIGSNNYVHLSISKGTEYEECEYGDSSYDSIQFRDKEFHDSLVDFCILDITHFNEQIKK